MTPNSTNDPLSIFQDGKLKPGIYKIQNLYAQTFMDIHEHSRDVCCRPATLLGEGKGLWEINPLGAGYSVRRLEPGKPEQFCVPLRGLGDETLPCLGVTPYPMAWRLVIAEDENHRGYEYVRLHWETTNIVWSIRDSVDQDGSRAIRLFPDKPPHNTGRIWKLIPVEVENTLSPSQLLSDRLSSGTLPTYDGQATEPAASARTQHAESEHEEYGTVVTEVTVVTSTVTTRKKYRVEDA